MGLEERLRRADQVAENLSPIIQSKKDVGVTTYAGIANAPNTSGVQIARGGQWLPSTVQKLASRAGLVV